jgi:hypothetical protein
MKILPATLRAHTFISDQNASHRPCLSPYRYEVMHKNAQVSPCRCNFALLKYTRSPASQHFVSKHRQFVFLEEDQSFTPTQDRSYNYVLYILAFR